MNVLTVGGRYICGDANSLMGVWADTNGGPLNYREIEELIAWVRASNTDEVEVRDPATGELVKITGWRDPAYVPAADATPVPACWKDAFAVSPSPMPSGGSVSPSVAPSGGAGGSYTIVAMGVKFDLTTLTVDAGKSFQIVFDNQDAGIPHNVAIHEGSVTSVGKELYLGAIFPGIAQQTYDIPAFNAGNYVFICTVHPNMVGALTVK
jgi:plastocyanin